MISGGGQVAAYIEDGLAPTRLLELKKKIHDQEYIDGAVQRIAQVISKKLVEDPESLQVKN